jgi:hypothetical protein
MDAAGNVGTSSNKALLHVANGQGAEFGVALTGTLGDNSWFTDTPVASLIGDVDPATVNVSVDGGNPVPFSQFGGLPAADGVYDLTATSGAQTVTLTVPVDSTAPAITTTPPITVSSAFQVGQAVTLTINCVDPNAPEHSGVASCTPETVTLDTSSPGTRSFTATASDFAGNTRTQTFNYVVAGPYTYQSVFPRTDRLNVIRAGWNLPLTFKAFGPNGQQLTATSAITTTISAPQVCPANLPVEQLRQSSMVNSPSNLFFFDSRSNNYVWIYKSPKPIPNAARPCFLLNAKAVGDTGPGISWWVKLTP